MQRREHLAHDRMTYMAHMITARNAALGCALAAALALGGCKDSTGPDTDPPSITTSNLPDGTVGQPYSESILATDGDGEYSWSLITGTLPSGLEFSVADLSGNEALISGTPSRAGSFSFSVRVVDGLGRADTASLGITIDDPPGPVAVRTPRLPPALAGGNYRVILQATGGDRQNFEWRVVEGSLPTGIELNSNGQFQGSPSNPGTATFTVEVRSAGFTARETFTLVVVPHDQGAYNITSFPVAPVPPQIEDNLLEAIRRWEAAIAGDLQAIRVPPDSAAGGFPPDDCAGFAGLANGTDIDDIIILMNIDSIDGPGNQQGNVLAQAGPCFIRDGMTPILGILILDSYDLSRMSNEERVTDIIQHEIAHVLGFGSVLWESDFFGVLLGAGTRDPRFTGTRAVAEYKDAGGTLESIPVENDGGEGTRDSHWRENDFGDELMTGFIPGNVTTDAWLSRMTIASLADIGYQVDLSAADDTPLLGIAADGAAADRGTPWRDMGREIIGVGPVRIFHGDGTTASFDTGSDRP